MIKTYTTDHSSLPLSSKQPQLAETTAILSDTRSEPFHQGFPEHGMDADVLEEMMTQELKAERDPIRNLATYGTTWMEPHVRRLMIESLPKNLINRDAYPKIAEYEKQCIRFLSQLWHVPQPDKSIGVATTGSSEAAILAGIALKHRWESKRGAACSGQPQRPNIVLGTNVHVCWKKLCTYLDIEPRYVLCKADLTMDVAQAIQMVDANTIGVVAVLGSSYNGAYDDVANLDAQLDRLNQEEGWSVPIHVDAASGGFVAPFLHSELEWDFRLKWVVSINTSGHKYGLVYPSVGWILWSSAAEVSEDLVFQVGYLGGEINSFALSFSRPSSQIVAQYYVLHRYGISGYVNLLAELRSRAFTLADQIEQIGPFELMTRGADTPVVSWHLSPDASFSLFELEKKLEEYGWQVPAYESPSGEIETAMMRIVLKVGFEDELMHQFLADFKSAVAELSQ